MAAKKEMTPLMKQYWGVKSAHPDKIILFRMGDFFEMFHEDAQKAAPILGIALTVRNKKSGDQTPMCGVPHHSIGGQINKLLAAGLKVAICDQVEDPKLAKGLVKREITRILSPGMVYDPETLDQHSPNYIAAFDSENVAFMDSTTGECFYYATTPARQKSLLENLNPVELVVSSKQEAPEVLGSHILVSENDELTEADLPEACRRLLAYAKTMQGESVLATLKTFENRQADFRLQISAKVLRHLEVFKTYGGENQGSLFAAINRTRTAPGARRLKQWMLFPLTDAKKIKARLDELEGWSEKPDELQSLRQQLMQVGDIERRLGKISQPNSHPRDLQSLGQSLEAAASALAMADQNTESSITNLTQEIERAFIEDLPAQFRDGGFIAEGYNTALDELISVATDSQKLIRDLEEREREQTGIPSLKIRYNNVFGFYIEVTNTHKSKVPVDRYQRKQTLTNAERYVTDELNELEKKVITAKSKRADLELELLQALKDQVLGQMGPLMELADRVSHLDVVTALAWLAIEQSYCRPSFTKDTGFAIEGSRHPVIEQFLSTQFVANDFRLQPKQCLLLTGPNMAGKSTIMRQVAVTSLLAQMGSFVPARKAELPIVDKIFTRIGASDSLTEGLSTFMVEMQETAEMLNEATENSLVVLDEVGRGTSTYDGMSLAQSILEYFLDQLNSYTLFATHYHELTQLEASHPGQLLNRHMAIQEQKGQILFRYHLAEGPAEKSYGIQVGRLAGLPKPVIARAQSILKHLEAGAPGQQVSSQLDLWQSVAQDHLEEEAEESPFLENIRQLEIQKLTPLEALNKLAEWQQELS